MVSKNGTLYLPTLRGSMGDWIYYVSLMKLKDLEKRVKYAREIYNTDTLNDLLQRDVLPNRANEIADYLASNTQRFFNSITIGVFGGQPEWVETKISEKNKENQIPTIPISHQGTLGYLSLTGTELLFPIDGQHRIAGVRELAKNPTYSEFQKILEDEVTVIFIGHKRTLDGKQRIRRLFTTLNRYAKPVSLRDIIALDEDDCAAIVTRELIEGHKLFNQNNISLSVGSNLSPNDKKSFTNIVTLYKCNDIILQLLFDFKNPATWNKFKQKRPPEEKLKECIDFSFEFWDLFSSTFDIIKEYLQNIDEGVHKYRNTEGGYAFFRPIGLLTYIKCISIAVKENTYDLKRIFKELKKINPLLIKVPWEGVVWESGNKRMIVRDINQKIILRLLLYMVGANHKITKRANNNLLIDYASLLNKDISEVKLPKLVAAKGLKKK